MTKFNAGGLVCRGQRQAAKLHVEKSDRVYPELSAPSYWVTHWPVTQSTLVITISICYISSSGTKRWTYRLEASYTRTDVVDHHPAELGSWLCLFGRPVCYCLTDCTKFKLRRNEQCSRCEGFISNNQEHQRGWLYTTFFFHINLGHMLFSVGVCACANGGPRDVWLWVVGVMAPPEAMKHTPGT